MILNSSFHLILFYLFKHSCIEIQKIVFTPRFLKEQPKTTWSLINPSEYAFYSNVNPNVDHPRWTQATERRIGEFFRRPTLMFNGYEEEVSHLYKDMDLAKYY